MKKAGDCNRAALKIQKIQEEARKKQPGAVCGRRAAERGISFPRRRGRRRVPGERPGRRFGNWCHWGLFLAKQPRRRRALPPVVPGRGCRLGIGGSAPFAAPWRSQFLFHIIKRNYESHGKALKPFPASLSFAASPRLGRGGIVCGWAWSRRRRPAWISSTLRTWFHSTYIKHKPESANEEACRMRPLFAAALRKRCFPNLEQSYEKQSA